MRCWSFSSLSTFFNCPRQYQLRYVTNAIPYEETEATIYGTRVHEALERYGRDGTPVPEDCEKFTKYVDKMKSLPGTVFFEHEMALTRNLEPCGFNDPEAWCRGVIDVAVIGESQALAADYKTGKVRPDSDQLKLFAGFIMQHYPVESVKTVYVWLKFNQMTKETYRREDIPEIWKHFITKAERLEAAYEKDKWIPSPSGLCRGWCGAKDNCEFWTPRR